MNEPEVAAIGEPVLQQQEHLTRFATGAVRGTDAEGQRWDLITPIGLRRLAETYAEGAAKYGEHNWRKSIPASVMLNHAIRHLYLYLAGDDSEDHLAHAAWNVLGVCHFEEALPEM
ncbi:dATP/dGTP diphosphohydrolase domain-containing protein, partial [Thermogutta sp.]|uniref:dATP/dGTP diphosphohydrolase domain-containing protein n=1 Tax=Thermogutta sp. TaxID=1962930 RepID=UPI003220835D